MKILITGGAGFIGSAVIRHILENTDHQVCNIDKLTYAGNLESLNDVDISQNYQFAQIDICDQKAIAKKLAEFQPDAIMHLAAESHVDRSIDGPGEFIHTNIVGTYVLLNEVYRFWQSLSDNDRQTFRFHHISTDEVYGTLGADGLFTEETAYDPRSPYSASKAASDHLVRAWFHTYGLPVILSNCSNNYGPYQFPEKLIPLVIQKAQNGESIPVYGKGDNIRDWLYVDDHARALLTVLTEGAPGESYNIGGHNELTNIEVVKTVCQLLDELLTESPYSPHSKLIEFVADRPGHDQRYAIDATKIAKELDWRPEETFETGIRKTVQWYLENQTWCDRVMDGSYQVQRLGLGES